MPGGLACRPARRSPAGLTPLFASRLPVSQAFALIEASLGRPLGEVFSSISERPIAAASLGQVGADNTADLSHWLESSVAPGKGCGMCKPCTGIRAALARARTRTQGLVQA